MLEADCQGDMAIGEKRRAARIDVGQPNLANELSAGGRILPQRAKRVEGAHVACERLARRELSITSRGEH